MSRRVLLGCALAVFVGLLVRGTDATSAAGGDCVPPAANAVACENSKPGNPRSEWDVTDAGDATIQGFATDISVDQGQTVRFKIKTPAAAYRIDIYRLGYYGGDGARKVATVTPSATLPQSQPACLSSAATGLVDCGNWAISASWDVPAEAVSGVYIARPVRTDTGGASHIVFVVRDDDGGSGLLFQTSDTTWQAYNRYGGNSLYVGSPAGRAYKVSYNRPFTTRDYANTSWLFSGEYPMIRWLERNGYDVSYSTGVDTDRRGGELLEHDVFLSVGHDEYWSGGQRGNVEAARAAGTHLAFFSGNEIFWKTRFEPSIDGTSTSYRTLVSYKETHANAKIDPSSAWTGTWRDPRFSPPADGGRPENALTGTIFTVNSYREDAITVPAADGALRFWRNTSVANLAAGGTATLPAGTLGHEWDADVDNGSRPAGVMRLSTTTLNVDRKIQDYGNTYAPGTATHNLTLYRASSGALVFGAGTVQWAWGLDATHDVFTNNPPRPPDARMQQATVNLLADMGAQPGTLQANLVAATQSSDGTSPTSTITSPASGGTVQGGTTYTVTGTAADGGGGRVAGIEVSVDGGTTWHPATAGRESWSYSWSVSGAGPVTLKSRAVDDSGNIETPSGGVSVTVLCPCQLWANGTPGTPSSSDSQAVELGVKLTSDLDGWITAIRFYKGSANTGTHVGSLWTAGGTLLSRATFAGETASGWQQVALDTPVSVTAGTTYVASYFAPQGRYAVDVDYFTTTYNRQPLHAPAGSNGVYRYGASPGFPTSSWRSSNYWVDVVFTNVPPADTRAPQVATVAPAAGATAVDTQASVSATFDEAMTASSITPSTFELRGPGGGLIAGAVSYDAANRRATLAPAAALAFSTTYTATVKGGASGAKDLAGNALAADYTWSFTTAGAGGCPCNLFGATVPGTTAVSGAQAVELGVKFRADVNGSITGVRFYKGATNTGTHVGSLWTSAGQLLARATFTGETASGWQTVSFGAPVAVTAGTTYVASYFAPNGHYAVNLDFFTTAFANAPLRAIATGVEGGNGVYAYAGTPTFPTDSWRASNYWVDVVFQTSVPADTQPPQVSSVSPAPGATNVGSGANVTVGFSEPMDPATITASTILLRDPANTLVPASVGYDAAARAATLDPTVSLAPGAQYTAVVAGGSSGVKDVAGNALASPYSWTFTVGSGCPCSIFTSSVQPSVPSSSDGNAVELGVRFRADTSGTISGLRFYKGVNNTGTHVGSLWSNSGALLARATFTGETASGWQTVTFASPVAISAGTTYVASYHAPNGGYAVTQDYFAGFTAINGPLRALANGADGANGVYLYSGTPAFPVDTWRASNYFVDVLFTPSP